MKALVLFLLLALGPAAIASESIPAPSAPAAAVAEARPAPPPNDLMPAFVTFCMKPQDTDAYFAQVGVKPVLDTRTDLPESERLRSYTFFAGDIFLSVMTKPPRMCAVLQEGVHDAATLASFEKFLQGASGSFDVVAEDVPPPTDNERIVAIIQLVDKGKQYRWRYTLSVGSRNGESHATVVSREMGAY